MIGPFEQRGGVCGPCQGSTPAPTAVIFAYGGGRKADQGVFRFWSVGFLCQLGRMADVGVETIPVVSAADGTSG